MSIGLGAGEGFVGGAVAGAEFGSFLGPAGTLLGALGGGVIAAALGAGFSALGYYLGRTSVHEKGANRDAVSSRSDRERPVPVIFGRARVGGSWIDVGGWWFLASYINRGVPNVRIMNAMLALCEGPVQSYSGIPTVGNFRSDGRPMEMLAGPRNSDTGAPCKVARFTVYPGSTTQPIAPSLLDNIGDTTDYPAGNRYGYTAAIVYKGGTSQIDPTTPGVTTGGALPYLGTAYVDITCYSDTVYSPARLNNINADVMGPDYTIRRSATIAEDNYPTGSGPQDVLGYAFYDSYSDGFYGTLASSGLTSAPFGLVCYGRSGAPRSHQPPPTALGGSATFGIYCGRHDVLIFRDLSDPSMFWIGYWGITATSGDWSKFQPSADYANPILAWSMDEQHSLLHSLHDDGTVRYILRWNLLTNRVDRLNTDLPSASFRAVLYSPDIARYVVARDSAAVHLIDPDDGTTVNLLTGMNTSACMGVFVAGSQAGIVSPNSLYYTDIYTGQVSGPFGGSSTGITTGCLGGIVSASQNTFTGKVTTSGQWAGNASFNQFAVSCIEDIRDFNANGTSGLSGLPNQNPAPSRYNTPEPNFQAGQLIGSQAFPSSYTTGMMVPYGSGYTQSNGVCRPTENAAAIQNTVTDAFRDWSSRGWGTYNLHLLEGNSSLAAAAWAMLVDEPNLDSSRYGAGFDPSYFNLGSFEQLHSWCVGPMTFLNPPDATSLNNPDRTNATRLAERYKFDFALEGRTSVTQFVGREVLMAAAAYSYTIGHVFHVGVPKPGLLPVYHLNERHNADGSFQCLYSANADGVNRIELAYRDVLDEYRTNVVQVQDENSVNALGRVQVAPISVLGCGRDQSAALLAKSVLDNSNAGRRQATWKTDYIGYVLAPTDGIEVSNKQCGLSNLRMRLSSVKETESGGNEHLELSAVEYRNVLDALDNNVNQTSQPGAGVPTAASGNPAECSVAYAPYVEAAGVDSQNHFNDGAALAPGTYTVTYAGGAYTNAWNGNHYFAHGYNICTRETSTGSVIKLVSAPAAPDDATGHLNGWLTYEDLFNADFGTPAGTATFVLQSSGTVFIQASGSITPYVATDTSQLTYQLCLGVETTAPDIGSVAGVQLWLRADMGAYNDLGNNLASSGEKVEQWNDQSGNSFNATQSTSGNRPVYKTNRINKYPSLTFTAANSSFMTAANIPAGSTFAIFAVYKINSTGADNTIYAVGNSGTTDISPFMRDGSVNCGFSTGPSAFDGVTQPGAPSGTWVTAQFFYDGSNLYTFLNGSQVAFFAFTGTPEQLTNAATIGRLGDSATEYFDGEIAELVVVSPCPSSTDRATIETALNSKYSLY